MFKRRKIIEQEESRTYKMGRIKDKIQNMKKKDLKKI